MANKEYCMPLRMEPELKDQLDTVAENMGLDRATVVRLALRTYLRKALGLPPMEV